MRLGIDFGTTRTVVAAAIDGRYPVVSFETELGFAEYVPGSAALIPEPRYGWNAIESTGAQRSIKRLVSGLAPDDRVAEFGLDAPSALALLTGYLESLKDAIRSASNLELEPNEPLDAMIAVPAHASTHQRYVTLEAFRRAGFGVLGMIGEPTAAAIEYGYRQLSALRGKSPKRYVIVYDLGGGTFDTSAVSLVDREFHLLATEGIARLGGDDFDELILDLALDGAKPSEARRVQALEACREAKEHLSPSARLLHVELPEIGMRSIEVARLVDAAKPLVDRTLERLERVLDALPRFGIDPHNPRELGAIYLVGGACAFSPVQKLLKARFKQKVQLAPQPHAAAAVGLAILADPERDFEVREGVTRHFGVWREAEAGKKKVFDRIFSKDRALGEQPVEVSRHYRPVHAVGLLRFVECTELTDEGEPAGDLMPRGELWFPYDSALAERAVFSETDAQTPLGREAEIVESYAYDEHGIVHVAIENRTEGYRREARFNA